MDEREYLIRLNVGGDYVKPTNDIPVKYYRNNFSILDDYAIVSIRPKLSLQAWSIYTVLAYWEDRKMSYRVPSLCELYGQFFNNLMDKSEFYTAIEELEVYLIDDVKLVDLHTTMEV